jgi:hypothetical protein
MNIYIPDIKLPKDEPGAFQVIVMYVGADRKLRAECDGTHEVTIVPPHGDLIDRREAIIDANERAYDFWLSDDEVNATIQFLNEQPTIIPAEEGET